MSNVEVVIPSSAEDRKIIKDVMKLVSESYSRIEGEKSHIKAEIDNLAEKYKIPKKFLNKLARTYHRQNFKDILDEQDDFTALYESVLEPPKQV
jgi:septation ring formation regulator EzrA